MKTKVYQRPTMKVVKLQHHGMLMTSTQGDVHATMNHEWEEEEI